MTTRPNRHHYLTFFVSFLDHMGSTGLGFVDYLQQEFPFERNMYRIEMCTWFDLGYEEPTRMEIVAFLHSKWGNHLYLE